MCPGDARNITHLQSAYCVLAGIAYKKLMNILFVYIVMFNGLFTKIDTMFTTFV